MIDPALSEKLIAGGVIVLTIVADFIKARVEKSTPSKKADEKAAAAIDISKVLLDHDKAHLEELDNIAADHKLVLDHAEARELHLTAANEGLLAQNKMLLEQIERNHAECERQIASVRKGVADLRESEAEHRARLDLTDRQFNDFRAMHERYIIQRDDEAYVLRNALHQKDHRGYLLAKRQERESAKEAEGPLPFTATDVWPEGKPPGDEP